MSAVRSHPFGTHVGGVLNCPFEHETGVELDSVKPKSHITEHADPCIIIRLLTHGMVPFAGGSI